MLQEKETIRKPFSPQAFSAEDVAVAFLVHRMVTLPKEALADLASLSPEFARCNDPDEFKEILETMKEILFPELIGECHEGEAGSIHETQNLTKRMNWIGQQIKKLRSQSGFTQEKLAKRSGLPQSHISRLEAGRHSPSYKTLERIAGALGVKVGELDPAHDDQ